MHDPLECMQEPQNQCKTSFKLIWDPFRMIWDPLKLGECVIADKFVHKIHVHVHIKSKISQKTSNFKINKVYYH